MTSRSSAPVPVDRQTVWRALKDYTPEFVPTVRELAERFGVDAVGVQVYGAPWRYWHRSR